MRRDTFLKTLALTAGAGWGLGATAASSVRMMIPANPGGGWDSTGRALGRALVEAKGADAVQYENKGGAAGVLGLTQFVNASKGDANALLMTGAVMVGGIITSKSPVSLEAATPIARLTSEYDVLVVPAASPLRSMKDVVALMRQDPAAVKWGGGSLGSTDHIAVCALARALGLDVRKVNYVPFRGGGEAASAVMGGHVTVGVSGYGEFLAQIQSGQMRALGLTSQRRLRGVAVPTLREQGYDVVIGNWRGVYGAPGITATQRVALTDMVVAATRTKAWTDAVQSNLWTPALMTGTDFKEFVDYEFSALRAILYLTGLG